MTLKLAIEEAISNAAPDETSLEVDGVVEPQTQLCLTFVPLELLQDTRLPGRHPKLINSFGGTDEPCTGPWPTAADCEWRRTVRAANLPGQSAFLKLRGLARQRPDADRRELCEAPLAGEHQHLLEPAARRLC